MNGMISRSLMGVFCSACFSVMNAQDRPNIVVFIVDDMGLMDTSVPFVTDHHGNAVKQPLNEWYRTPIGHSRANPFGPDFERYKTLEGHLHDRGRIMPLFPLPPRPIAPAPKEYGHAPARRKQSY